MATGICHKTRFVADTDCHNIATGAYRSSVKSTINQILEPLFCSCKRKSNTYRSIGSSSSGNTGEFDRTVIAVRVV